MASYEFNDCGVCLNPDRIELDKRSRINICEHNGKWFSGYDLDYVTGGTGTPCSLDGPIFDTKREARLDAFARAIACIEGEIEWYKHAVAHSSVNKNCGYDSSLQQCYKLLKVLNEKKEQRTPVQLSLFD